MSSPRRTPSGPRHRHGHNFPAQATDFSHVRTAVRQVHHRREVAAIDDQTVVRQPRHALFGAVFDLDGPSPLRRPIRQHFTRCTRRGPHTPHPSTAAASVPTRQKIGTRYVLAASAPGRSPAEGGPRCTRCRTRQGRAARRAGQFESGDKPEGRTPPPATLPTPAHVRPRGRSIRARLIARPRRGAAIRRRTRSISTSRRQERRQDGLSPQRRKGAGRRLLVDQRLHAKGYYQPNSSERLYANNITAKKAADGSIAIQFGGGRQPENCRPYPPAGTTWSASIVHGES